MIMAIYNQYGKGKIGKGKFDIRQEKYDYCHYHSVVFIDHCRGLPVLPQL